MQRVKISVNNIHWLEPLHQAHYPALLRLARSRLQSTLGSAEEAEDIVQEAFELALKKNISQHEAPLAWLLKTVDHLCRQRVTQAIKRAKRQLVLQQAFNEQVQPPEIVSDTNETEILRKLEETLSPDDWTLMWQYCIESRPVEEIARERNVSINAIRVQVYRIRQKIKKFSEKV